MIASNREVISAASAELVTTSFPSPSPTIGLCIDATGDGVIASARDLLASGWAEDVCAVRGVEASEHSDLIDDALADRADTTELERDRLGSLETATLLPDGDAFLALRGGAMSNIWGGCVGLGSACHAYPKSSATTLCLY